MIELKDRSRWLVGLLTAILTLKYICLLIAYRNILNSLYLFQVSLTIFSIFYCFLCNCRLFLSDICALRLSTCTIFSFLFLLTYAPSCEPLCLTRVIRLFEKEPFSVSSLRFWIPVLHNQNTVINYNQVRPANFVVKHFAKQGKEDLTNFSILFFTNWVWICLITSNKAPTTWLFIELLATLYSRRFHRM